MATTQFDSNNDLTLKLWAKAAFKDAVKETLFGKLIGKSERSIVQVRDDLQKSAGDRIRFRLRALPAGQGTDGDETLEGKEEGLSYSYFDLGIDQKRHAHKIDLGMDQQRVNFDLRKDAKEAQSEWWEEYLDTTFIEYLAGINKSNGKQELTFHQGTSEFAGNSLSSPTRVIYGGGVSGAGSLTSSDTFDLSLIDNAVAWAKTAEPTMRRPNFSGKSYYVMVLHPWQVHDLRTNTSTGQWLDIQKAAMQGGKVENNPIWSEALGMYNGVILVENTRVPTIPSGSGSYSVDSARALFLSAQAGVCGFGRSTPGTSRMRWVEKTFDYDDKWGVSASLIYGMRKTKFDTNDFGLIAIDTAAKDPNS